jgi:UDP-N-acetylmuramoylalanine--D-glutamate ligase
MTKDKSYTIHKGKQSQTTNSQNSRQRLKKNLEAIAYRMDSIRTVADIEFISDTRAVDLLSTRDSFKCLEKQSVWLTTTTPFERDYALIEKLIKKSIKSIVVYGGEVKDMLVKLDELVEQIIGVVTLEDAVIQSYALAAPGEAVIYSPGCVNEDGYLNFVDRGRAFENCVKLIQEK